MQRPSSEGSVYSFGVLTLSDKGSRGEREDTSGPALKQLLENAGLRERACEIIADQEEQIVAKLQSWADEKLLDLIVTTGGTGVAPSDVTPEATRRVIEKEVPGMAEAMRLASLEKVPTAMLSRAVVGIRGRCLIINVPGSKKAAVENLESVLPALDHALYKLQGGRKDCGTSEY
jgi:molybdenum cofactor synthesis domain-containing protein